MTIIVVRYIWSEGPQSMCRCALDQAAPATFDVAHMDVANPFCYDAFAHFSENERFQDRCVVNLCRFREGVSPF